MPLPKQRGRIETAADLSVPDYPGVWALGDCAAMVNAHERRISPPTAQFAARQAQQLAYNLLRSLRGEPTRPFSYESRRQFATIGHQRAVAEVFGERLSGLIAWTLRRGVYLVNFPTLPVRSACWSSGLACSSRYRAFEFSRTVVQFVLDGGKKQLW